MLTFFLRNKVDLTKYIEEHHFTFDNVYELDATNEQVSLTEILQLCKDIRRVCEAISIGDFQRCKNNLFRLRSDRIWKDSHYDGQRK